jgi:hypothetical protein
MAGTEEPMRDQSGPEGNDRFQDPFVDRFRPDPAAPATRFLTLSGLGGRSDRPGYRRLYTSRSLSKYLEFRAEDVIDEESVPPEREPMPGLQSTTVHLRRDAAIDQVSSLTAPPADQFDLDLRTGGATSAQMLPTQTWEDACTFGTDCGGGGDGTNFGLSCPGTCGETCQITLCRGRTCPDLDTCLSCRTCNTDCNQATCATCNTNCGQATCATCNQATCATCNQATCATCNQATCATCNTDCGTCRTEIGRTCLTANPHVFTCGARC